MSSDWNRLQALLGQVSKPSRYTGGEFNSQTKDWATVELRIALAFPDLYELGLSHIGLRILYEIINSQPQFLAERVYAPWPDLQQLLRQEGIALYSLESKRGLAEFDLIGFSLQYELTYTNILTMLDLAGIPWHSSQRSREHPLIIGGGPCGFNPEPLAEFFDFFLIGEAEEIILPLLERVRIWKQSGAEKAALYNELAPLEGVYIPSQFEVAYNDDGTISQITSVSGARPVRAVVRNLAQAPYPKRWIVPYLELVHDRVAYEIQRGCTRGCRFCQAGMIYRPVREKDPGPMAAELQQLLADTGYQEASLASLSSADYSQIEALISATRDCCSRSRVNLTLPSLRTDSFSVDLAARFQGQRKGSLTFAPEAGTERLRRVINKGVTDQDLFTAVDAAFRAGWQKLKLYFMIGLPTETEADLAGIVELVNQVLAIGRSIHPRRNSLRITVSLATFVPKAHTPFQWQPQLETAAVVERQRYLQERLRGRSLELSWHDPQMSMVEGIMARGDRRLAAVLETAWRLGAQFDGWTEQFRLSLWLEAFKQQGLDPLFYLRERDLNEVLPWSHLNTGLKLEFLKAEWARAKQELPTPDCRTQSCQDCGVCPELGVAPRIAGGSDV